MKSCIERWLGKFGKPREAKSKCPECNQIATKKDIRVIWAKKIVAVDTIEKDQALKEAQQEKMLREQADMKVARLQLAYQMASAELDKVHDELGRIRQEYNRCRQQLGVMRSKYEAGPSLWSCSPQGKYITVDTVPISLDNNSARVVTENSFLEQLFISRSLGSRSALEHHGLLRLNMRELSQQEFIPIHAKAVRDAHCSPIDNNLVLTTSLDKTMKLVSLTTNSVVQSFDLGAPGWSCCWNSTDTNYVFSGQSNNSIRMFDLRYTKDPVKNFQDREKLGMKPIHSLVHVPQPEGSGRLLAANLEHAFTWNNLITSEESPLESSCKVLDLQLPGSSCYSVSYDRFSNHMLTSFRNVGQSSTHHIVSQIENTSQDLNVKHICQLDGRSGQTSLSKTTIFTRACARNTKQPTIFVCAGDEASSSLLLWDVANSQYVFQELSPGSRDTFLDIKSVSLMGKDDMLVGLTDKMLHLFKWVAT
ncbi:RING finger and WD repeat domain-containing protein 3, variant 3 [Basidiobolus ranarum]|uniref:RING finger and WD repeat domain-containing protein 3, variant 3 n=1 Tax=Basidiobolus ranarum TaxID=34480 RepID=A0ABR2W7B0_9FUNG